MGRAESLLDHPCLQPGGRRGEHLLCTWREGTGRPRVLGAPAVFPCSPRSGLTASRPAVSQTEAVQPFPTLGHSTAQNAPTTTPECCLHPQQPLPTLPCAASILALASAPLSHPGQLLGHLPRRQDFHAELSLNPPRDARGSGELV